MKIQIVKEEYKIFCTEMRFGLAFLKKKNNNNYGKNTNP